MSRARVRWTGVDLETAFARQLTIFRVPAPEREHRFAAPRRWRFDFAWPAVKLAAEIEGGIWSGGRHTSPTGFINDCEKYNCATELGWRVLRYTAEHIKSLAALEQVSRVLRALTTQRTKDDMEALCPASPSSTQSF